MSSDETGSGIPIARTIAQMHNWSRAWKDGGEKTAFVPTMGNLHAGHLALVKAANDSGMRTVVSIFVNPKQFGENEDFDTYPRTLEDDLEKLGRFSVDAVFAPEPAEMYPHGAALCTEVHVRGLSDMLEGECRPGFFLGVATVVNKLFNIVQPDAAYFGEKDYQQLLVIRRMVRDLNLEVDVRSVPTVREADGLAMSSRNSYLNAEERRTAPRLQQCLRHMVEGIRKGTDAAYAVGHATREMEQNGLVTDYVVVRCRDTLAIPSAGDHELVALAAAWLGETRLIDNIPFELEA